ncbi:hypothetical protein L9F63_009121, partial [Diploptera punctata]
RTFIIIICELIFLSQVFKIIIARSVIFIFYNIHNFTSVTEINKFYEHLTYNILKNFKSCLL